MKILLVEPKTTSIAYNLALLKWARFCVVNGYEYQYIRGKIKHSDYDFHRQPKLYDPDSKFNIIPDKIYISCIFSFYSKKYEDIIDYYHHMFLNAKINIGGVFPSLNPEWFNKEKWKSGSFGNSWLHIHQGRHSDIENLVPKYDCTVIDEDWEYGTEKQRESVLKKQQKVVLYTSRGCVNNCGYCAVPKLEGKQVNFPTIRPYLEAAKKEVPDATSVVLYDNNLTEQTYIKDIVDELVEFDYAVDVHGLHVSAFTPEFAEQMARLKFRAQGKDSSTPYMRFSFDKMKYEPDVWKAMKIFSEANIDTEFFCYMLYNWIDSPEDFWKRIIVSHDIARTYKKSIYLFPQRYEPFQALEKYKYVGSKWTPELASGVRKLATWLHGFITCSPSLNIFQWIGYDLDEFKTRCENMTDKKYRLEKKTTNLPNFQHFLKQIS